MKNKNKKVQTTIWDFLIEALHFLWKLIDKGHLATLFVVVVFIIPLIITIRLPPEQLRPVLLDFVKIAGSRLFLMGIFCIVLLVIIIIMRYQRKHYKKELKRLGKEKSYYVHNKKKLPHHHSSQYHWEKEEEEKEE